MNVRVAIIGTGGIAGKHAEVLQQEVDDAQIVAAVDVRDETVRAFAERFNIPATYTKAATMLAQEKPDIVHICTPPHLHAEQSIQALEAGSWVLCEKPLAASLKELDAIAATETHTGRYCSSVYQWRFGNGAQHLKGLIDANSIGKPILGICQTTWYRDDAYYAVPWRGTWKSELGGCSMGHGIHAMDLFLWLYGPWQEVNAKIGTLNHDIEVEDVSLALVNFENGAMGTMINSVVSPRQESYIRMDFQEATVELKHLYAYKNNQWSYSSYDGNPHAEALKLWQAIPDEKRSIFGNQVRHHIDCFKSGDRPLTSGYGARMTLEFLASMYKSAMTGQSVKRGSIQQGDPFYDAMNGSSTQA
ncbi:MAG: Gfo/Idh/MocA family oxidoreductase [Deinococcales bacterium]